MARGLSMGVLRKTGEKRATKYFAADGTDSAEAATKPRSGNRAGLATDAKDESSSSH